MNSRPASRNRFPGTILVLLSACASSSTVRVPVDDAGSAYREVQRMDCDTYDAREKSLTVGLSFGVLWGAANVGPYVKRAEATGMRWDRGVHIIIARYKELCSRFNTGAISQQSYDARIAEIDQLYNEAAGIRQAADALIRGHAGSAFGELDRESAAAAPSNDDRVQQADGVAAAVDAMVSKLGVQ